MVVVTGTVVCSDFIIYFSVLFRIFFGSFFGVTSGSFWNIDIFGVLFKIYIFLENCFDSYSFLSNCFPNSAHIQILVLLV